MILTCLDSRRNSRRFGANHASFGSILRAGDASEVGTRKQSYAENSDYGFKAFQLQIMRFSELWKCR
ncbi:hypothetical protein A2U01_0088248, partial [Trifolium medium]|nr:hypothetical protein [Trifolium medium]